MALASWPDLKLPPLNLYNCWQRNPLILREDAKLFAQEFGYTYEHELGNVDRRDSADGPPVGRSATIETRDFEVKKDGKR